jgi:hypothetical protein
MQKLLFEEMMILSKTEKKAMSVKFNPSKNLILGENDVGKSTLIKSLYHSLGADAPQLNNNRWKKANPIYCTKFVVDNISYYIVRDEKYFGLFDSAKKLISRYQGITGEKGIANRINKFLKFNIDLEAKDGQMQTPSSSYYFLPFYIDQDEGWNSSWSSFSGLQRFKNYRKEMIDYHLGIKPQTYYDAISQLYALKEKFTELSSEKSSLISVRDKYKSRKEVQKVDLDPEVFRKELEEVVVRYNDVYSKQQNQLGLIKNIRNNKLGIENEISVLESSIRELESDYKYLETPSTPDVVDCPTCGTEFKNSISERFGLLDDIDYSINLIDQKKKELILLVSKLEELNAEYNAISKELSSVESLLQRKKESISLAEIIRSEGYKDMIGSIASDIDSINAQQVELDKEMESLKDGTKTDKVLKRQIVSFYQAKMKESLNKLNVHVLTEDDYKNPERVIKNNALGSDLPRSLLAQYISLLHTMEKFNSFVHCPLIIDSPLQQEQDEQNADAIFSFIFSGLLKDQQLILGTLNYEFGNTEAEINVIELNKKYGLLDTKTYPDVFNQVSPLHAETISVSE